MQNEKQNQKPEAGPKTSDLRHPPADRMVKAATTRDVLGRDPKANVILGGFGKLIHRHD